MSDRDWGSFLMHVVVTDGAVVVGTAFRIGMRPGRGGKVVVVVVEFVALWFDDGAVGVLTLAGDRWLAAPLPPAALANDLQWAWLMSTLIVKIVKMLCSVLMHYRSVCTSLVMLRLMLRNSCLEHICL